LIQKKGEKEKRRKRGRGEGRRRTFLGLLTIYPGEQGNGKEGGGEGKKKRRGEGKNASDLGAIGPTNEEIEGGGRKKVDSSDFVDV